VFVNVADPVARRTLREALAHDASVRFVASASAADIIVGDAGAGSWPANAPDGATVRDERQSVGDGATGGVLTEREQDVLQALSEGLSNRAIAERFGISRSTVKFHLHAVFEKLGVHGRAEAVTAGVRRGHVLL
jgi:DNA-binding NarL/FixJ family response regulator